jgi:hypothetical protein
MRFGNSTKLDPTTPPVPLKRVGVPSTNRQCFRETPPTNFGIQPRKNFAKLAQRFRSHGGDIANAKGHGHHPSLSEYPICMR